MRAMKVRVLKAQGSFSFDEGRCDIGVGIQRLSENFIARLLQAPNFADETQLAQP